MNYTIQSECLVAESSSFSTLKLFYDIDFWDQVCKTNVALPNTARFWIRLNLDRRSRKASTLTTMYLGRPPPCPVLLHLLKSWSPLVEGGWGSLFVHTVSCTVHRVSCKVDVPTTAPLPFRASFYQSSPCPSRKAETIWIPPPSTWYFVILTSFR